MRRSHSSGRKTNGSRNPATRIGAARATVKDVASEAGVSKSTVSLVVRGSPLVAETTRQRVLKAIDDIGYVYNRGAATLRSTGTQIVALVVPHIDNPFFAELTAGADAALDSEGFVSFLANTAETQTRQQRFLERMREHRVDGVIICPATGTSSDVVRRLKAWGIPCIQLMRHVLVRQSDYVAPDFKLAGRQAVDHLVAMGHRRIAFVGGAFPVSVTRERYAGFRLAMKRHGLNDRLVYPCPSNFGGGAGAIRQVLAEADQPTAAFCFNDIVAMGVMSGLAEMNLRTGTDFAVIGFDNLAEGADWSPPLTTIAPTPAEIGAAAAHLLIRRISDPTGRPERLIIPTRLVVRGSCGAEATAGRSEAV